MNNYYLIAAALILLFISYWAKKLYIPKFKPTEQDILIEPFIQRCFTEYEINYVLILETKEQIEYINGIYIDDSKRKIIESEINRLRKADKIQGSFDSKRLETRSKSLIQLSKEFREELYKHEGSYLKYLESKFIEKNRKEYLFQVDRLSKTFFPIITILLTLFTLYTNSENNKLESEVEALKLKQSQDSKQIKILFDKLDTLQNPVVVKNNTDTTAKK